MISARSVVSALSELGHEPLMVGVSLSGRWVRCDPRAADVVPEEGEPYALVPGPDPPSGVDVVFPVFHGPYGEDGSIQGLLEFVQVAYVGAGVEGSVLGVNKVLQKRVLGEAGLPLVRYVAFNRRDWTDDAGRVRNAVDTLGYPSFAKPARLGSSVGISKIHEADEIDRAVERALHHDDLVLVEAFGGPRELEIAAVETTAGVELTDPGEVVPEGEFYDYESKYRSESTELRIPAEVPAGVAERVRSLAERAFRAASCEGFARVDFFYDPDGERVTLNEINTIPGLTPMSMFPRLWEVYGRSFSQIVQMLLDHALDRHERRARLERRRAAHHDEEVGPRA